MKTLILSATIAVLIGGGILNYLSLPIAGVNQSGACVYLVIEGKKLPCDTLPPRYVEEHVAGW